MRAAALGVDLVTVCPTYVLGVPLRRTLPGETSTRIVGHYLAGKLPAVVSGAATFVDVRDAAEGHLLAAERGMRGERYVIGGSSLSWPELINRLAELSGERRPVVVLPAWIGCPARVLEAAGIPGPIAAEAYALMGQNWRYSSAKAICELGYTPRPLEETLNDTIDWYQDLLRDGRLRRRRSTLTITADILQSAAHGGLLGAVIPLERLMRRPLVVGVSPGPSGPRGHRV
jgi:dihydroflavonol-4-reductase